MVERPGGCRVLLGTAPMRSADAGAALGTCPEISGAKANGGSMVRKSLIVVVIAGMAATAIAAETPERTRRSLDAAVATLAEHFNAAELEHRDRPQVELNGPPAEPYLARATYRQVKPGYELLRLDADGPPVATVRVRAGEFEKRATNVQGGNPARDIATAAWHETPRGYLLDFTLRWDGTRWQQVGSEVSHPILGIVGADELKRALEHRER
jgi:hypothetical protein